MNNFLIISGSIIFLILIIFIIFCYFKIKTIKKNNNKEILFFIYDLKKERVKIGNNYLFNKNKNNIFNLDNNKWNDFERLKNNFNLENRKKINL
ncbi:MAG: hypothetical protein ACRCRZ_02420, partial [Metamycoplasmataceae bacterium]